MLCSGGGGGGGGGGGEKTMTLCVCVCDVWKRGLIGGEITYHPFAQSVGSNAIQTPCEEDHCNSHKTNRPM